MAEDHSPVADRLKEARFLTAARQREAVSQERMAELIGQELKRTFHPTQWRRYEGGAEPPLEIIRAVARLSGLSPAYIAFGEESALDIDESMLRDISDEELARAERIVAERERLKAKRGAGGGGSPS
jgi:transcriptional regulator with XRE-family HTH domain